MPPNQQIPSSPREAVQLMEQQLEIIKTEPWYRNFAQATASSQYPDSHVTRRTAEIVQTMGLGYTSLVAFAVEAAAQSVPSTAR